MLIACSETPSTAIGDPFNAINVLKHFLIGQLVKFLLILLSYKFNLQIKYKIYLMIHTTIVLLFRNLISKKYDILI